MYYSQYRSWKKSLNILYSVAVCILTWPGDIRLFIIGLTEQWVLLTDMAPKNESVIKADKWKPVRHPMARFGMILILLTLGFGSEL
jgi:hypothetical protein